MEWKTGRSISDYNNQALLSGLKGWTSTYSVQLFQLVQWLSTVRECFLSQQKKKHENKTAVANHRTSIMGILDITLKMR